MSSIDAQGSDGLSIDLDSAPTTITYNADGTINYIQVSAQGNTYRQTFTYVAGQVTAISAWVKQ